MNNKKVLIGVIGGFLIIATLVIVLVFTSKPFVQKPSSTTQSNEHSLKAASQLITYVPNNKNYSFKFPAAWHVEGDAGGVADVFVTNAKYVGVDERIYPTAVTLSITTVKSAPVKLEDFVKNKVPKEDRSSLQVTPGVTNSGLLTTKATYTIGTNELIFYAIALDSKTTIQIEVFGYSNNPAIDEVIKSFSLKQ